MNSRIATLSRSSLGHFGLGAALHTLGIALGMRCLARRSAAFRDRKHTTT